MQLKLIEAVMVVGPLQFNCFILKLGHPTTKNNPINHKMKISKKRQTDIYLI